MNLTVRFRWPMDVGAMKDSNTKGDTGKKGHGKSKCGKSSERPSRKESTAKVTSTARVTRKARAKERKAKVKDRARRRDLHLTRVSQVFADRVTSGDTERTSAGNVKFREWRKLRVLPPVQQCEDGSCYSRG